MPFACSICEQESTKICGFCTKDACDNHLCPRCGCCSDCCECEVPLDEAVPHTHCVPPAEADHPATIEAVAPAEEAAQSENSVSGFDPAPSEATETPEV